MTQASSNENCEINDVKADLIAIEDLIESLEIDLIKKSYVKAEFKKLLKRSETEILQLKRSIDDAKVQRDQIKDKLRSKNDF